MKSKTRQLIILLANLIIIFQVVRCDSAQDHAHKIDLIQLLKNEIKDLFDSQIKQNDPDEYVPTPMLIINKGYPAEQHEVITGDGYKINIHRIPYGVKKNSDHYSNSRPVVYLQHGLLDGSHGYVMNFPDQSLGFLLADSGYDVWLGNMRGNTYGLNHVSLNKEQDEFWNFSFDEFISYDLPDIVNFILKATNQTQLIYVGHSQGTLIGFGGFSKYQDLASKIKLFVALAPVAEVKGIKSPIKILANLGAPTNQLIFYSIFGKKSFLPSSEIEKWLADKLCNLETTDKILCSNLMFILGGPTSNLNITRLSVYTTHDPAGTSVKNMIHWAQCVKSGKFQMFDYNSDEENLLHYNQTTPPNYDITKVKIPVALYWGSNDWLADPSDVQYLRENLPNIVDDFGIGSYDHLDFIWAVNARRMLYDRVIRLINKYATN